MNNNILQSFLKFKASKKDLIDTFGDDLYNVSVEPDVISSQDVISAIQRFKSGEIDVTVLLDWVNIIWFTDLYEYKEDESDCIASVMTVLETLDEDGVSLSTDELNEMLICLSQNKEYNKTFQ